MYINEAIIKAIHKYGDAIYLCRKSIPDMYVKGEMFGPVWKYHKTGERMPNYCLDVEDLVASDWDVYKEIK